ncbi:hypothetical protein ACIBHX_22260 [Nonomuraea sp. NPDC050536]|uniref:arsenate reductase/protein-tyrosine-phosphatase family protein n=1 Tax=Nonomuraea sp. NPDC050536 TaxID=3364366 RepID=UPI0037C5501C
MEQPSESGRHRSASDFILLFVCTANICRSPIAERLTRAGLPALPFVAMSAGSHAIAGRPMAAEAAAALRECGGNPDGFTSQPLTEDLVRAADLVLTGTAEHRREVVTMRPQASSRTFTILEFGSLAGAVPGAELMEIENPVLRAHSLVERARLLRGVVRVESLDVADPFGGPGRGYKAAARRIAAGLAPFFGHFAPTPQRALDVR